MSATPSRSSADWRFVVAAVLGCALVATVLALGTFYAVGGRWFIVETPSMGTAAPVGTLVMDLPVLDGDLRVGDVISFSPPSQPGRIFTHRVVAVASNGDLTTRGDLNAATDPWALPRANVVGRAVALLPDVGWALRGLPMILVGSGFVWLCTLFIRASAWRSALRVLGVSLSISVTVALLRPLVASVLVTTEAGADGARAVVVSTGALPIRVTGHGAVPLHLISGELGRMLLPRAADGHYLLSTTLDLSPIGWAVVVAVCLLPLAWTLTVGLPQDPETDVQR